MFEAGGSLDDDDWDAHDEWRTQARAALEGALGDPRVHAGAGKINPAWRPVLFVTDTDGDMNATVHSIDVLNERHPTPSLVASARAYFNADE
ncbi:hypothetical protein ACFQ07_22620 [Actinomadura adrarensis]|uniref:Uncharacterized protein n=1 Tax=Actinomadura adrarensis TaxID=1819600 RepID=A0ABW3CKY5_9ACTN